MSEVRVSSDIPYSVCVCVENSPATDDTENGILRFYCHVDMLPGEGLRVVVLYDDNYCYRMIT